MKQRYFILTTLAAFVAVSSVAVTSPKRPNVIVILTDDQGWGDLGSQGHPYIQSPNVDALAAEGLRFTQGYAAAAVCSPSRSSILTGRTPFRNGVYRFLPLHHFCHLPAKEITLPQLLRESGYQTAHFGKWHLSFYDEDKRWGGITTDERKEKAQSERPLDPFVFGIEGEPSMNDYGYDYWLVTGNVARPSHKNPCNFFLNGEPLGMQTGFAAQLVGAQFEAWMQNTCKTDEPFFATVWLHEPHGPIESDPRFMDLYKDLDDSSLRQYLANITQLDEAVGQIVKVVEAAGQTDNTLIWYTSDNGPEGATDEGKPGDPDVAPGKQRYRGSTGGLNGRKRYTHEGGIRVPMIIKWPAGLNGAGTTCDVPVIGSDIFPTVLELAGIPLPTDRTFDCASIAPVLKGESMKRERPLFWRNSSKTYRVALRDGDWKILADGKHTKFLLFNLEEDPNEATDLAGSEPERLESMKKMLLEYDLEVLRDGPDWWKKEQGKAVPAGL
ncbi:sulfatase family protein [Pontiella sulfatireligans]|uniref:Arylsulfatase n=1 Tax=Pontiella sulfatireligans TaxID=2750658 RepID=A0A6C2UGR6_9BACT|nr:sulfatase-like hydrolase/transferase [Pontiella sulfatireligans]SPS74206.1 sulfatase S1_23 [Kiritimatiellales bacterium]VGO18611.1 Arylsulfatase [Pontiella sulfatireligans]